MGIRSQIHSDIDYLYMENVIQIEGDSWIGRSNKIFHAAIHLDSQFIRTAVHAVLHVDLFSLTSCYTEPTRLASCISRLSVVVWTMLLFVHEQHKPPASQGSALEIRNLDAFRIKTHLRTIRIFSRFQQHRP